MSTVEDIMQYITANSVKWVDMQFTDLDGRLNNISVSSKNVADAMFSKGYPAELSSVFGPSDQNDLALLPDPETSGKIPWEGTSLRVLCDIITRDRERYLLDPRYMIERVETNLKALGVARATLETDVEFYAFDGVSMDRTVKERGPSISIDSREAYWSPSPIWGRDNAKFPTQPFDALYAARIQIMNVLEDSFGYGASRHSHGRNRTGHQSIGLNQMPLKTAADALQTVKYLVRNLALLGNTVTTFMPLPIAGEKGSQLTTKFALWKANDTNLFYDADDKYDQLSQTARYFIGGLLEHAPALCAFTNPCTNSYKRLFYDRKQLVWGKTNESASVLAPPFAKNDKMSCGVSFALPDSSANPYLAYSAALAAGIDGIKSKTDPGDPQEGPAAAKKGKALPESMEEALSALESDTKFLKGIVSPQMFDRYVELKRKDIAANKKEITPWEMERYFNA